MRKFHYIINMKYIMTCGKIFIIFFIKNKTKYIGSCCFCFT